MIKPAIAEHGEVVQTVSSTGIISSIAPYLTTGPWRVEAVEADQTFQHILVMALGRSLNYVIKCDQLEPKYHKNNNLITIIQFGKSTSNESRTSTYLLTPIVTKA